MSATAPDPQIVREFCDDMTANTSPFANVDVTEVRKDLIAESYRHHASLKRLTAKGRLLRELTAAELDTIDAHSAGAAYAYLLAGVLRVIQDRHGVDEAREMAALFSAVSEVGNEVLEDANDDLDEQVRVGGDAR